MKIIVGIIIGLLYSSFIMTVNAHPKSTWMLELGCVEYHYGDWVGPTVYPSYATDEYEWSDKEQKPVQTKKYVCWEKK